LQVQEGENAPKGEMKTKLLFVIIIK